MIEAIGIILVITGCLGGMFCLFGIVFSKNKLGNIGVVLYFSSIMIGFAVLLIAMFIGKL